MTTATNPDIQFTNDEAASVLGTVVRHQGRNIGRVRKSGSGTTRGWWCAKPTGSARASGYIYRTRRAAVEDLLRFAGR